MVSSRRRHCAPRPPNALVSFRFVSFRSFIFLSIFSLFSRFRSTVLSCFLRLACWPDVRSTMNCAIRSASAIAETIERKSTAMPLPSAPKYTTTSAGAASRSSAAAAGRGSWFVTLRSSGWLREGEIRSYDRRHSIARSPTPRPFLRRADDPMAGGGVKPTNVKTSKCLVDRARQLPLDDEREAAGEEQCGDLQRERRRIARRAACGDGVPS